MVLFQTEYGAILREKSLNGVIRAETKEAVKGGGH